MMKINGLVIDQKENKNPLQFKNVTVWASSGLKLRAADAYIRNLTLEDLGAEKVPDGLEIESTSSEITEFGWFSESSQVTEGTEAVATSAEITEGHSTTSEVTDGGTNSQVTEVGSINSEVTEAGGTSSEGTEVGSIDSEVTEAGGTSSEVTSCQSLDLASTLQLFDFSSLTMAFVDIHDTRHKIEGVKDIPDMMLVGEVILVQCHAGEVFNDRDNNTRKRWFCMESGEIINKYSKNSKCLTLDQVECFVPTAQPTETTTSQIPNTVTTTETKSNPPESTTPTATTATSTTIKTSTSSTKTSSSTTASTTFTSRGKRVNHKYTNHACYIELVIEVHTYSITSRIFSL